MGRLDGKAAIVTGAGQGIGRGVARSLAREGAAVNIAEINARCAIRSEYRTRMLNSGGGHINGVQWDPPMPE